jgi:hypothetical protein
MPSHVMLNLALKYELDADGNFFWHISLAF